jgi:transcriptional regulator with XRE-family HTH domain
LKSLGDHLRKKRLDLKLSQKDVAQELGVDEASINNWERGHTTPALNLLPRVLKFIGYIPPEMPTETLPESIKTYRRIRGNSQKALSKELKINPSTLARWERGKGRPRGKFLQTLIGFFESLRVFPTLR